MNTMMQEILKRLEVVEKDLQKTRMALNRQQNALDMLSKEIDSIMREKGRSDNDGK